MADTISANTSSLTTLPIDTWASSAIDFVGDTDWWRTTLNAGYGYIIDVRGVYSGSGSLADPWLGVLGSAGAFASLPLRLA